MILMSDVDGSVALSVERIVSAFAHGSDQYIGPRVVMETFHPERIAQTVSSTPVLDRRSLVV